MTITSPGGLSDYVLMPGKRIIIEDTAQITIDVLKEFRSTKTNRSITDDFKIEYNIKTISR